jgi:hypothetical protein
MLRSVTGGVAHARILPNEHAEWWWDTTNRAAVARDALSHRQVTSPL